MELVAARTDIIFDCVLSFFLSPVLGSSPYINRRRMRYDTAKTHKNTQELNVIHLH